MYILKAKTKDGIVYYMNVMMVTGQKEYAQKFKNKEDAENSVNHFMMMHQYETINPVIEEI